MMNGVALFLVITSIVTGSFWSPPLHEKKSNPNVIIKEGHQFVVVEYDQQGEHGTTKILISPHQHHEIDSSKEEITSTAKKFSPRELVCDELGKCKSKIAGVFYKVEEQTKEGVTKGVEKVKQVVDEGTAKIKDAYEKMKESDIVNKPKSTVKDIENDVEKNNVVGDGKTLVKDAYEKVKETNLVDMHKRDQNIEGNVTTKLGWVKGFVQKVAKSGISKLKEGKENGNGLEGMAEKVADDTKEEGAHRMTDAVRKTGGLASDGLKEGTHKVDQTISKIHNKRMEDLKEKVSYLARSNRMKSTMGVVHLVGFSVAFGMSMWMTFVSTYILKGVLPRTQFGKLQSRIYPVYFKLQAYSIAFVFLVHLVGRKSLFINSWELFHVVNLLVSLLMSLVNLLHLEPRATEVMSIMLKIEKLAWRGRVVSQRTSVIADDAGKSVTATTERQEQVVEGGIENSPLTENLRKFNRLSAYINLVTLISLSLHLVYLGQRI